MLKRHLAINVIIFYIIVFYIIVLLFAINTYAQSQGWKDEDIPKKTAEDIINDPANARNHWSSLSDEQKEAVFKNPVGLAKFSNEFAERYGITALSLKDGLPRYDGISLINGDALLPLAAIRNKNAEITSLKDGGFRVKFPDNTDISKLELKGGTSGIIVEGNNIKLEKGELAAGGIVIYKYHLRLQPNSEVELNKVSFKTDSNSLDIYYGVPKERKTDTVYIDIDRKALHVRGDLIVALKEGHEFERIYKQGKATIYDGAFPLYAGEKGKTSTDIPIKTTKTKFTVIDEDTGNIYLSLPNQALYAQGYCSLHTTGNAIAITGFASTVLCNHVTLVPTGAAIESSNSIFVPKFEYVSTLFLDNNQAQEILQRFIAEHGREPNLDNIEDLKLIAKFINERATYIKLEQRFEIFPQVSEDTARFVIEKSLRNVGIKDLSNNEQEQLRQLYALMSSAKVSKGDRIEYEVSGDRGEIKYLPKRGEIKTVALPSRIVKALIQNYYDPKANKDPYSKYLLQVYFSPKRVAQE